jgi:endonuclease G
MKKLFVFMVAAFVPAAFTMAEPAPALPTRIELPRVENPRWFIEHKYYALEYDTSQFQAFWVAYVFNDAYLVDSTGRASATFRPDPLLPEEFRLVHADYTYSGYSRGHLCPSADRVFSEEANLETFYMTNVSPLWQSGFNSGIWLRLEERVRAWAKADDCDTMYIATGGAIKAGIANLGKLSSSEKNITIPQYFYKALLKRKGNTFTGIGFWLENRPYSNVVTHAYSMSIRELEEKTKIDFFPNLDDDVENEVETTYDVSGWPL